MQLSQNQRRALITRIRNFPNELKATVSQLSEAQLNRRPIDGEWSIAQNVHHIADSHLNSYIRTKLILTEDHPTLRPYDQDAWATLADGRGTPFEDSLMLLAGLHRRWATLFESLSDDDWQRVGYHPEMDEDISLDWILQGYVHHGAAHLAQIEQVIEAVA